MNRFLIRRVFRPAFGAISINPDVAVSLIQAGTSVGSSLIGSGIFKRKSKGSSGSKRAPGSELRDVIAQRQAAAAVPLVSTSSSAVPWVLGGVAVAAALVIASVALKGHGGSGAKRLQSYDPRYSRVMR